MPNVNQSQGVYCFFYFVFQMQVHLQTQQKVEQRLVSMAVHVVRTQGVLALYNGLSASLTRQVHASSLLTLFIFLAPLRLVAWVNHC